MLRVVFREIKPGKEQKLRTWLAELNRRADEVRATFKDETVRAEQSFIVAGPNGPMLVGVVDVEDPAKGAAAFAASKHRIDAQHRAVMKECLGPKLDIQPLYDVSASGP